MIDNPYLRRAQEALEQAKARQQTYRGPCDACIHYQRGWEPTCGHPAVALVAFNVTRDYDKDRIVTCAQQRDASSIFGPVVCGPDGALFDDGKAPPITVPVIASRRLEPEQPLPSPPQRRTFMEWLHDLFVGKPA